MKTELNLKNTLPWIFAALIFLGYASMVVLLINRIGSDESLSWERLLFVFAGVEALMFAAMGFVFGKEVNRNRAINAERESENQKKKNENLQKQLNENITASIELASKVQSLPFSNEASSTQDNQQMQELKNLSERMIYKLKNY